jgi:hypothetical protein
MFFFSAIGLDGLQKGMYYRKSVANPDSRPTRMISKIIFFYHAKEVILCPAGNARTVAIPWKRIHPRKNAHHAKRNVNSWITPVTPLIVKGKASMSG